MYAAHPISSPLGPLTCLLLTGRTLGVLQKSKYLIPMDMTVGQLVYVLRKRISLPSDKAIFVFVNNTCVTHLALPAAPLIHTVGSACLSRLAATIVET